MPDKTLRNSILKYNWKENLISKKEKFNKCYKSGVKELNIEAPVGFEPTNKGFADLPLKPLGYSAIIIKIKIHLSGF